ncbi:hypothetical protein P4O66_010985, partial [Electrophorus voltai]
CYLPGKIPMDPEKVTSVLDLPTQVTEIPRVSSQPSSPRIMLPQTFLHWITGLATVPGPGRRHKFSYTVPSNDNRGLPPMFRPGQKV